MLQEMARTRDKPRPAPITVEDDSLDEAHDAVWRAIRHLFPARAMVDQVGYGWLLVSWKLPASGGASSHFAAPLLIRIESGLLLALWTCDDDDREAIAREQEEIVRAHLEAYDPHSRTPTCGVIVLGQ